MNWGAGGILKIVNLATDCLPCCLVGFNVYCKVSVYKCANLKIIVS